MASDKGKDENLKKLESFVLELGDDRFLNSKGEVIWSRFGKEVELNKATISNYKKQGYITKIGLQKIYSHYPDKFNVTKFGYEVEELTVRQKQTISPYFYYFGDISKDDFAEKVKDYFQDVVDKFHSSCESFEIYMYLPRGKNKALGKSKLFHDQQQAYLNILYGLFKDKQIKKYNRILVLPLDPELNVDTDNEIPKNLDLVIETGKKPRKRNLEKNKFNCIKEALDLVFLEEFEQLWNCLCLNDDTDEYQFNLYVHRQPSRLYSFGILDEKILIKEHDRYGEYGSAQPDMLYVYEKNGEQEDKYTNRMMHTYQEVINEAVRIGGETERPPVWKITKSSFKKVITLMLEELDHQIKQIEILIKDHKGNGIGQKFDEFYWSNLKDMLKAKRTSLVEKNNIINQQK